MSASSLSPSRLAGVALALFALATSAPRARADAIGSWHVVPPIIPLSAPAAVYDSVGDRMLVYGGATDGTGQVHAMSMADSTWSTLEAPGGPGLLYPNYDNIGVLDPVQRRLLFFGGNFPSPVLWTFSLTGTPEWTQIVPLGYPKPALAAKGVYDPVGGRWIVVAAGYSEPGSAPLSVFALSLDPWPTCTQLSAGGGPSGRTDESLVYDSARQRVILYGGHDVTTTFDDLWAFSLTGTPAWTHLDSSGVSPGGRFWHSAIYDPQGDRMLVFGGRDGSDQYSNDTYQLALSGTPTWSLLPVAGDVPTPRGRQAEIYDSIRHRAVIYGGGHDGSTTYALTLGATPTWTALDSRVPDGTLLNLVYDAWDDAVVAWVGVDRGTNAWMLPLHGRPDWTKLTTTGDAPAPRVSPVSIYDPLRNRLVLFSGNTGAATNDTWALTLTPPRQWTRLGTTSSELPLPRWGATGVYDPVRDRLVIFGGTGSSNDTWALPLGPGGTWTQLAPSGPLPAGREYAVSLYDPILDRLVIFGGTFGYVVYNDSWALSLSGTPEWAPLSPGGSPPVTYSRAAFDEVRDRMVVTAVNDPHLVNALSSLSLGGGPAWSMAVPNGSYRFRPSTLGVAYDPLRDSFLFPTWFDGSVTPLGAVDFGEPRTATVGGMDAVWHPGATDTVTFQLTNGFAFPTVAQYALTSQRDWPGASRQGTVTLPANSITPLPLPIPTPDSVAVGVNTLHLDVTLAAMPLRVAGDCRLGDATTPVLVSLVAADATSDRVHLVWQVPTAGFRATLERRTAAGAWTSLAALTADGVGRIVFDDVRVVSGTRYGYRLVPTGGAAALGETWIDVPPVAVFALTGARPNPAVRELTVEFSLADRAAARIELLDLAGRRVRALDLPAAEPGSHVVRFTDAAALAPGLYFVRLTQGSRARISKVAIVR